VATCSTNTVDHTPEGGELGDRYAFHRYPFAGGFGCLQRLSDHRQLVAIGGSPLPADLMYRLLHLYTTAVCAAAILLLLHLPWAEVSALSLREITSLVVFVFVAVAAEALALDFSTGMPKADKVKTSITFLIYFTCALVFPAAAAVAIIAVAQGLTEVFLRKPVLWKTAFNIAQAVLALGVGILIYEGLSSAPAPIAGLRFVPFVGLAFGFFATNLLLVSGAFAVREQASFLTFLKQAVGPAGGNLVYDLLASPVAIVAAVVFNEFKEAGLVLVVLPLLLIRSSYASQRKLQQANKDLLRVLIKAIETRDPYTSGHSVRVSILARTIAEDLGLPRRKIEQIETAGLLHDIGKIDSAYVEVIRKPSSLSDDERNLIQTHATKGAELLQDLASLDREIILSVRHHHERYDGRGYPSGLTAKTIPIGARIIMLSDSVDAMLSTRPYRPALSISHVRSELERCAGTQFDPDIVHVMLEHGTLERAAELVGPSQQTPPAAPSRILASV
jgi:putative nucleotidyltransferase with HDIG domain